MKSPGAHEIIPDISQVSVLKGTFRIDRIWIILRDHFADRRIRRDGLVRYKKETMSGSIIHFPVHRMDLAQMRDGSARADKIMHFFPQNYEQLRDYFLSIFSEKSSGKFIFKSYPTENTNLIFEEDRKFKYIRKLKFLKKPAIFVYDEDEEDDIEQFDKKNIEFITNNLGFDYEDLYLNFNAEKIKNELERKKKVLEHLQQRLNYINDGINILKRIPNNNENKDDLNKEIEEFKKNKKLLDSKFEKLE